MATDATSAPATTTPAATPAPAGTETTATPAPAPGEGSQTVDWGKLVAERLGGKAPPADASAAPAKEPPAEAAPVAEPPPAAEPPKTPPPAPDPKDDIDARMKALHEATMRAAEARKERERENGIRKRQAEIDQRAKALDTAHAEEIATAKALRDAKTKGDVLGVLRAAGYTNEEIQNSPLLINLIDQMSKVEDGGDQPKPLTQADVDRILQEREAAKAAEAKRLAEEEKAKRDQANAEARDLYFAQVKVEYKAGHYPALKTAGVTQGGLDAFRAAYVRENPNHDPTAKELLDLAEKQLVASWRENAERLQALEAGQPAPTSAAGKQPAGEAPAPKPQPRRTVTSRLQAEGGGTATAPETPAKKPYREKEREMKNEFVSRFAK